MNLHELLPMLGPGVGIQWVNQKPNYHPVLNQVSGHKKRHPKMPFLPTDRVA